MENSGIKTVFGKITVDNVKEDKFKPALDSAQIRQEVKRIYFQLKTLVLKVEVNTLKLELLGYQFLKEQVQKQFKQCLTNALMLKSIRFWLMKQF